MGIIVFIRNILKEIHALMHVCFCKCSLCTLKEYDSQLGVEFSMYLLAEGGSL